MKVPNFPTTACGVAFSSDALHAVLLKKTGDRIKVIKNIQIKANPLAPEQALVELHKKWKGHHAVCAVIPPEGVTFALVPDSLPEDASSHALWSKEALQNLFPDKALEEYIIQTTQIQVTDDLAYILIGCVFQKTLSDYDALFKSVGLSVYDWSPGWLEAGYAFILNPAFVAQQAWVVWHYQSSAWLMGFDRGYLTSLQTLTPDTEPISLLEEANLLIQTRNITSLGSTETAIHHFIASPVETWERVAHQAKLPFVPGYPIISGTKPSEPLYPPAAGAAIKALYPALPSLNFLAPDQALARRTEKIKTETLHWFLRWGGGFLLLWALITLINAFLTYQIQRQEPQMTATTVQSVRLKRMQMRSDSLVAAIRELKSQTEHTHSWTPTLFAIAENLPSDMWLQTIQADSLGKLNLRGYTTDEKAISQYVSLLQKTGTVHDINKIVTSQLDSLTRAKLGLTHYAQLRQFEIGAAVSYEK